MIKTFSNYAEPLVEHLTDKRSRKTITTLLEKMKNEQSCKIYTLSSDLNEYERFSYQLKKVPTSGLDLVEINKLIMKAPVDKLGPSPSVTIIHDPSDIRKPYSQKMESIGRVKSLEGDMINGYRTINSIAIGKGQLYPLSTTPYSSKEEDVDKKQLLFDQASTISKAFKEKNPELVLIHLIDREADDAEVFDKIDDLKDRFVIRAKANRNSDVHYWNEEKGKEMNVKLIDKEFSNNSFLTYEKFIHKNKVYQNVRANFQYEYQYIKDKKRSIVKVELFNRNGNRIFKQPILLITSFEVNSELMAQYVYHLYLKRSKIEGVFKFLKETLGWEEFQVQDLIAIKNILLLCFFIGAYYYEIEHKLTQCETMKCICKLGGGKGKVSRSFFLRGLENLYHFQKVNQFFKENNLSEDEVKDMLDFIE